MVRETTSRFLIDLLAPGGVVIVAAWALQQEAVVRDAAAPYAIHFAVGALAAAILLCWYHDSSRLLSVAMAVALTVAAVQYWSDHAHIAARAAIFLLPLNFAMFGVLRDSGVITAEGCVKLAIVGLQAAGVRWMAGDIGYGGLSTPWVAECSFAIAALTLLMLVVRRRTKPEQGLLWALAAMFLSVNGMASAEGVLFYVGAAGLILVLTVLEHGYHIAYRDELTGLLGRRAFNSMMGQLGRTYAIAMCDVDHFKKFNDTYGHDAGDHVLRMVAARLAEVGGGGRVFRYGGEEFLVVFRGRSAKEAAPFAEAVRKTIANRDFVLRGVDRPGKTPSNVADVRGKTQPKTTINITVSIGLAERSQRHSTPELVLDAADAALYRAKEAGRNTVQLADSTQNA